MFEEGEVMFAFRMQTCYSRIFAYRSGDLKWQLILKRGMDATRN